jgi:hypothetical protein
MHSTHYLRSTSSAEGTVSVSGSTTSARFTQALSALTTTNQTATVNVLYGSFMSSTAYPSIDYSDTDYIDFADLYDENLNFNFPPVHATLGLTVTTATTTAASGTSTFYRSTTATSLLTYWFFSTGTLTRPEIGVVSTGTHTAMAAATIYQAGGPFGAGIYNNQTARHEALYEITSPQTFYSAPVDARSLAQTATRITVYPTATIEEAIVTTTTAAWSTTLGSFSTSITQALSGTTNFTFSKRGALSQSSSASDTSWITATSTRSVTANWSVTASSSGSSTASSTLNSSNSSATYSGETLRTTSTQGASGQTVIRNTALATELPVLIYPTSYAGAEGTYYGTRRITYGKSGWAVNGSVGRTYTAPSTGPSSAFIGLFFSASSTAGIKVVLDQADSRFTIRGNSHTTTATTLSGSVPTTTTRTAPPGVTYATSATTSSYPIGVSGSLSTFSVNDIFQEVGGLPSRIRHFGGGPFAENWTVIEEPLPAAAYSDMINDTTASFLGHDTSYSGEQTAPLSRFTAVPYLRAGGNQTFGTTADRIVWSERRNEL